MKKFFAIIMTICLMTTALCLSALPVSAGGDFKLVVQGRGYDGRYWLIDTYEDFEKAIDNGEILVDVIYDSLLWEKVVDALLATVVK